MESLSEYLAHSAEQWQVAGLSVAVVKDHDLVYAEGFGVKNAQQPEPEAVTTETLVPLLSNTKLFTAVATGILVDRGVMALDDPVKKHLPGFELFDPHMTAAVTLRDLLANRTGIGNRGNLLWYATGFDRAEVLRRLRHLRPRSALRSRYGYQNIMFMVAGEALAAAAGMSWGDFVEREIFAALGMNHSSSSFPAPSSIHELATPHVLADGSAIAIPHVWFDNIGPATTIYSNASDMTIWMQALLATEQSNNAPLVSHETLAEITTPHIPTRFEPDAMLPTRTFNAWGLGTRITNYQGRKLVYGIGGFTGMMSLVALLPEEGAGIVALANTLGHTGFLMALMYQAVDALLEIPAEQPWSDHFLQKALADGQERARAEAALAARRRDMKPSLPLEAYAGTYDSELYGPTGVALANDQLTLHFGSELDAAMEHWEGDRFRLSFPEFGSAEAGFELGPSGGVDTLRLDFDDTTVFRRPGANP
jgi:CubicO group peptidase (beta-lactamase class C family)